MTHRAFVFSALVWLALTGAASAAEIPTIDQTLSWQWPLNPRLSPDGRLVAYEVRETNWEENAFETEIWIADTRTGERYPLTHGKKSSSSPRWSPDGQRVAFLSDREGKRQLYLIGVAGGEALRLTNVEAGVASLAWSPDGKHLAFAAADPEPQALKERKEKYGEFEIYKGDYVHTHLWLVEVPAGAGGKPGEPVRLTDGKDFSLAGFCGDFSWSPDGSRIAFSAARDPDISSLGTCDLYVLRVADKQVEKLVGAPGPDTHPVWSPDGAQIAYLTANGNETSFFYTNRLIAVLPASGGQPRPLSEKFDESPWLLAWGRQGIYFTALQKTNSHLFRLDPSRLSIERLSWPERGVWGFVFGFFTFDKEFRQTAFWGAAPGAFPEIYVATLEPFAARALTAMGEQVKSFRLATRELIEWKSTDGTPVEGVLIKPADFDASRRYPLLMVIHGGPTWIDLPVQLPPYAYPIEQFAARGALILLPNYRGSIGYGEKFRSLNVRNLGIGDYWDLVSGIDELAARGWVDAARVGVMGWSQGGYISAFVSMYSDRFRAASVGAGISDWATYYATNDLKPWARQYLRATPWEDPEIYRQTAPVNYIKRARTPTLIQHPELDRRVPLANGLENYQALEDHGVPVKLVIYKGFGHGVDKPKAQRALLEQNYEWFSRWIWDEKAPDDK